MKTDRTLYRKAPKEMYSRGHLIGSERNMSKARDPEPDGAPGLVDMLGRLLRGAQKIYVATKYWVYQLSGRMRMGTRLPWMKLGLIALAVYVLLKKDVQFSIDMRAPEAEMVVDDGSEMVEQSLAGSLGAVRPSATASR
ncbi:MAG: hypothetical protein R3350_09755, partial [Saprospiraceae bacterium]|nr:hypothetical protein [Saprospiraceae bacterium]